jgi:hypothetical protein
MRKDHSILFRLKIGPIGSFQFVIDRQLMFMKADRRQNIHREAYHHLDEKETITKLSLSNGAPFALSLTSLLTFVINSEQQPTTSFALPPPDQNRGLR